MRCHSNRFASIVRDLFLEIQHIVSGMMYHEAARRHSGRVIRYA